MAEWQLEPVALYSPTLINHVVIFRQTALSGHSQDILKVTLVKTEGKGICTEYESDYFFQIICKAFTHYLFIHHFFHPINIYWFPCSHVICRSVGEINGK